MPDNRETPHVPGLPNTTTTTTTSSLSTSIETSTVPVHVSSSSSPSLIQSTESSTQSVSPVVCVPFHMFDNEVLNNWHDAMRNVKRELKTHQQHLITANDSQRFYFNNLPTMQKHELIWVEENLSIIQKSLIKAYLCAQFARAKFKHFQQILSQLAYTIFHIETSQWVNQCVEKYATMSRFLLKTTALINIVEQLCLKLAVPCQQLKRILLNSRSFSIPITQQQLNSAKVKEIDSPNIYKHHAQSIKRHQFTSHNKNTSKPNTTSSNQKSIIDQETLSRTFAIPSQKATSSSSNTNKNGTSSSSNTNKNDTSSSSNTNKNGTSTSSNTNKNDTSSSSNTDKNDTSTSSNTDKNDTSTSSNTDICNNKNNNHHSSANTNTAHECDISTLDQKGLTSSVLKRASSAPTNTTNIGNSSNHVNDSHNPQHYLNTHDDEYPDVKVEDMGEIYDREQSVTSIEFVIQQLSGRYGKLDGSTWFDVNTSIYSYLNDPVTVMKSEYQRLLYVDIPSILKRCQEYLSILNDSHEKLTSMQHELNSLGQLVTEISHFQPTFYSQLMPARTKQYDQTLDACWLQCQSQRDVLSPVLSSLHQTTLVAVSDSLWAYRARSWVWQQQVDLMKCWGQIQQRYQTLTEVSATCKDYLDAIKECLHVVQETCQNSVSISGLFCNHFFSIFIRQLDFIQTGLQETFSTFNGIFCYFFQLYSRCGHEWHCQANQS